MAIAVVEGYLFIGDFDSHDVRDPATPEDLVGPTGLAADQIAVVPDPDGRRGSWLTGLGGVAPAHLSWRVEGGAHVVHVEIDPRLLNLGRFWGIMLEHLRVLRTAWAAGGVTYSSDRTLRDPWLSSPDWATSIMANCAWSLATNLRSYAVDVNGAWPPPPRVARRVGWLMDTLRFAERELRRRSDVRPYTYDEIRHGLAAGRYVLTGDTADLAPDVLRVLEHERARRQGG